MPADWALKPSGINAGDKFRLLFMTSTQTVATSSNIGTYNTFVQTRAKAGHSAITDSCGNKFKAVVSTSAVDARDNAGLTGTGEKIFWLNGARLADNYADFWDGTWDSYARKRGNGNDFLSTIVYTGSNTNGTKHATEYMGATIVRTGRARSGNDPFSDGQIAASFGLPLYAMSPVFKVETPSVSVSGGDGITEGGKASFTVTASQEVAADLTVNVSVADAGGSSDFVDSDDEGAKTVTIEKGKKSATYEVQTTADSTDEPNGNVTLTVETGTGYTVGSPSSDTVAVADDDGTASVPTLSISTGANSTDPAPENQSGVAERRIDISPHRSGSIPHRVCFSSSFTTPSFEVRRGFVSVTLTNGCADLQLSPTAGVVTSYRVGATTNDTTDEPDEVITMTLSADPDNPLPSGVSISTTANTSTIVIRDDDPTVVSLARTDSGGVTEGGSGAAENAEFTVTLGRALERVQTTDERIDVPLAISGTGIAAGDYTLALKTGSTLNTGVTLDGANTLAPTVTFKGAGAKTATLVLTPVADNVTETEETLTLALGANTAFSGDSDTNVGGGATRHGTDNSFDVPITNAGTASGPVLKVTGGSAVTEGTAAAFALTSNPAPGQTISYNYRVTDASGSDFVNQGDFAANLSANAGSKTHTVSTAADSVDEPNGTITFTLLPGTGYTVGTPSSATVQVNDNDATTVTLAGPVGNVTEGSTKTITVTLGRALKAGEVLPVPLTFAGTAARGTDYTLAGTTAAGVGYANLNSGSATVTFTGSSTAVAVATLTLTATTDSFTDDGETVQIGLGTLNANSGTGLGGGASSTDSLADFSINDPAPSNPTVSVSLASDTGTEGQTGTEDKNFTVSVSPPRAQGFMRGDVRLRC